MSYALAAKYTTTDARVVLKPTSAPTTGCHETSFHSQMFPVTSRLECVMLCANAMQPDNDGCESVQILAENDTIYCALRLNAETALPCGHLQQYVIDSFNLN